MPETVPHPEEGQCRRIGVLTNPLSGGNKKGGRAVQTLLASYPEILHRNATNPGQMLRVLTDFAETDTDLIVINGGDGTIQAVLTILEREKLFTRPPLLALLCAGTTSMLPRDVGVAGSPTAALQRIIEWSKGADTDLVINSRPILQVKRQGKEPLCGMFFGAGAICEGIKIFHSKDNPMGWRGQLMPALTMLRMLLAILFNSQAQLPPLSHKASLNGSEARERTDLFLFVTSLERLFMGMRPYWGEEDAPLYYTAIAAKPKYLLRVLCSLFRSNLSRHATVSNGYTSHKVQDIKLIMKGDFTLDGELYDAGEGSVAISASKPVLFLCSR